MSRIRSIHPNISTDEAFICLSIESRVLILELGTVVDYADRVLWTDGLKAKYEGPQLNELIAGGLVQIEGDVLEVKFAFGFPRRRISKWESLRSQVFYRDGYACVYCGSDQSLHCDHVVPVSRGGGNELSNLATACQRCNLSKHDKLVEEWLK